MKVFQIAALALSATTATAAVKKVKAATECSHTTCVMESTSTAFGVHDVMKIVHSNVESKCAGYQTVAKNNYIVDLQKKVHCGRVKRWVSEGGNAGKFVYDGPCECHVKGSHPNSAASQEVVTKPCAMVQCQAGWTLAGADERGCGGTCAAESTFFMAPGAENCPTGKVVNTEAECRKAATSIGRKFAKAVADKTGRPAGCFWDKNGAVYYNKELGASATWGGVGGLCRPVAMAVPACEADKYMAAYPDLERAFGKHADGGLAAAAKHWHRNGKKEGRTCPTDCDWEVYLARYADLTRAFGTDVTKARDHYESNGLREGRSCVPSPAYCDWQAYLDRYADLAAAFGANNVAGAEAHFMRDGAKEGRDCKK